MRQHLATLVLGGLALCTSCEEREEPPTSVAAARATTTAEPLDTFVQAIELDGEPFRDRTPIPLRDGYAFLTSTETPGRGQNYLFELETPAVMPLPRWAGDPFGTTEPPAQASERWRVPSQPIAFEIVMLDANVLLAMWTDVENGGFRFQLLRDPKSEWTPVGRLHTPVGGRTAKLRAVDGVGWLSRKGPDGEETFRFDPSTQSWVSDRPNKVERDEHPHCAATGEWHDLVRWGSHMHRKARSCVAARVSPNDGWTLLTDPRGPGHQTVGREYLDLPGARVLVVGGFIASRENPGAHVVDLEEMQIREVGPSPAGWRMDRPGQLPAWVAADGTVRQFDPKAEKFAATPRPAAGFEPGWALRVDERTVFLGLVADEVHLAKIGLR